VRNLPSLIKEQVIARPAQLVAGGIVVRMILPSTAARAASVIVTTVSAFATMASGAQNARHAQKLAKAIVITTAVSALKVVSRVREVKIVTKIVRSIARAECAHKSPKQTTICAMNAKGAGGLAIATSHAQKIPLLAPNAHNRMVILQLVSMDSGDLNVPPHAQITARTVIV